MKSVFKNCLVLFFALIVSVHAAPSLKIIPNGQSLKVLFTQHRYLADLPNPIVSKGELLLWNGKGVIWRTKEPFPSTILITNKGVLQIENENKTLMMQEGQEGVIFEMLSKLISGSFSEVKGFSTASLPPLKGKWRLRLNPTNEHLQSIFSFLAIEGDDYVSYVTIHRSNGDKDEIFFNNHSVFSEEDSHKIFSPNEVIWLNE